MSDGLNVAGFTAVANAWSVGRQFAALWHLGVRTCRQRRHGVGGRRPTRRTRRPADPLWLRHLPARAFPGLWATSDLRPWPAGWRRADAEVMTGIIIGVDESDGAAHVLRWGSDHVRRHGSSATALMAWSYRDQHHLDPTGPFELAYSSDDARRDLDAIVDKALGAPLISYTGGSCAASRQRS